MAPRIIPTIARELIPASFGEAQLQPVLQRLVELLRTGSQRRILSEAADLNRYLLSESGMALNRESPVVWGALAFAVRLLNMHALDQTPVKSSSKKSLALLAPAVGGRARVDDDAE